MTDRATSEMHWRSLALLNLFRALSVLGLFFLGLSLIFFPRVLADSGGREPFFWRVGSMYCWRWLQLQHSPSSPGLRNPA